MDVEQSESRTGEAQAGESQPSRAEGKARVPWRALTFALVAVVVGLGAGFLMLRLADSGRVDVRLGDAEFRAGSAESLSDDIAEGGPVLLKDPNSDRDIFVQHLGEDPNRGWLVFETRWPGSPTSCGLTWEAASRQFVPPDSEECEGLPRAEEDGTAARMEAADAVFTRLPQHRIAVRPGGQLIVTLLADQTDE